MAFSLDPTGIGTIAEAAAKIISLFKLDPNVKAQMAQQLADAQFAYQGQQLTIEAQAAHDQISLALAQIGVNTEEAKSPSWFIAGWRPFIGWVCGSGLAYGLILQPFLTFGLVMLHRPFDPSLLPKLDSATITGLLIPLLGLGIMRTVEKVQGVEANRS
jgi:hypothetical protein